MVHLRIVLVLCLALPFCLSGCSGDDTAEVSDEIREAIRALEDEGKRVRPTKTGPLFPKELIRVLLYELGDDQKGSYAVAVRYGKGNRDLEFGEAEFTARMASAGEAKAEKDALHVLIRNGQTVSREFVSVGDAPEALGDNILPMRAIRAARSEGLDEWWDKHPGAILSAELVLREKLESLGLRGRSTWVWRIVLAGGGEPQRCTCYVASATLRFLKMTVENVDKGAR